MMDAMNSAMNLLLTVTMILFGITVGLVLMESDLVGVALAGTGACLLGLWIKA